MTLRNVPKAHTLEQQRQEINLIASDLDTAVDGTKTFGGSKTFSSDVTFQSTVAFDGIATFNSSPTFSDNIVANFGDNADLKIYYDGSLGVETSFIDSDALQIRSESDTSELYATFLKDGPVELYYDGAKKFGTNLTGATVLGDLEINDEIHSASGAITLKVADEITPGNMITAAIFGGPIYAPYGFDTYNISNIPTGGISETSTTSGFSVGSNGNIYISTGGSSALWKGKQTGSTTVTSEINAQGNARFNGITQSAFLVNRNNTPTDGEGIELFYDSAASGGAAGGIQAYDRDNNALTRLKIRSSNWEIENNGAATFGAFDQSSGSSNGTIISHDGQVTVQRPSGSSSYLFRGFQGTTEKYFVKADGSASFAGPQTLATPAAPASNGYTSHINNDEASTAACYSANNHNADGINFLGVDGSNSNAITCKIKNDGSAEFAGTLTVGASIDLTDSTVDLYSQTTNASSKTFQLFSDIGGTKVEKLSIQSTGDIATAGTLTFTGQTSGSSATSDALDHYEEGTWTPTPLGLSNSPTFSNLKGRYVRIGSLVQINGFLQMGSSPTWTDVNAFFRLGPLPFAPNTDNAGYNYTAGGVTCQSFNFHDNDYSNTGQVNCAINVDNGVGYVIFVVSDNNNTRGTVKNSALSGNDIIEFSLTYRAG